MSTELKKQKIIISTLDASIMGGVERVVSNLSSLFTKNGHAVEVISFFQKNKEEFFDFGEIEVKYLSDHECDNGFFSKLRTFFLTIHLIKLFEENDENAILISTYPRTTVFLSILARKLRRQIIAHEHSSYHAHSFFVRILRLLTYGKLRKVVTLTEHDKLKFQEHSIQTVVIPNFIEDKTIPNSIFTSDSLTCLSAGRLHKDKGFDRLLKIAKQFRGESIHFYIVGSGSEEQSLKELIKDYGLSSQISLMPATKNLYSLMSKCDLYLLTSRTEAFPLVMVEALSLSKPIIAFDCPIGPREIIKDSLNGYLVHDGDILGYASKIKKIMESPKLYKELSEGAYQSYKNYNPVKNYELWSNIF